MKPYYDHAGITIYCGDSRSVLPFLQVVASCAIVDPPYGETELKWDRRLSGWPQLVAQALEPNSSMWCFGSMRMFLETAEDFVGWRFAQDLVWEKHNGSGLHTDRFRRVHELAAHFYRAGAPWRDVYKKVVTTPDAKPKQVHRRKRPTHWGRIDEGHYKSVSGGPRIARSVQRIRSCHGSAVHPTQKPLPLIRMLLEYSLRPGGVVLDPFMGSGTTLVAAREMGRHAVGIELEERYCEIAANRLSQEVLPLGAA